MIKKPTTATSVHAIEESPVDHTSSTTIALEEEDDGAGVVLLLENTEQQKNTPQLQQRSSRHYKTNRKRSSKRHAEIDDEKNHPSALKNRECQQELRKISLAEEEVVEQANELIAEDEDIEGETVWKESKFEEQQRRGLGLVFRSILGLLKKCCKFHHDDCSDDWDFDEDDSSSVRSSMPGSIHVHELNSCVSDISDEKKILQQIIERRKLLSIGATDDMISKMQEIGIQVVNEKPTDVC